jgi:murein DD-endopeptidase MepM/ murein hydrolase activator NlpD
MQNYLPTVDLPRGDKSKIKILTFSTVILIFTFLIFNFVLAAVPNELREAIDKKSQELQEVSDKIKENQKNLEEIQGKSQTLQQEVNKVNSNINQLNLSIRSSEITVDKLVLEVDSLQYEIVDAEKEIVSKKEAIANILQEFQKTEDETPLLIFLKNKSLADSVSEAQNLADLNSGLRNEINDLRNAKEAMADKLEQTAYKKQAAETENGNLKNRKLILDDVKKEKKNLLDQTKNQEKAYQKIISDLEKKQMEIADEIDKLEENLRFIFNPDVLPAKRPGVLGYPTVNIRITQEYGNTSFAAWAYKSKFHNGMDFGMPIGTPIFAAEDGEVMAIGDNGKVQYGKFVLIKHNNNLATLYAHLSRQTVKKGDSVKRGQIIGYSGNTGYSTGPHLHFGVYWAPSVSLKSIPGAGLVPVGVTINPADYL